MFALNLNFFYSEPANNGIIINTIINNNARTNLALVLALHICYILII